MELMKYCLWNRDGIDEKMFMQMGMDEMFWN